MKKHKKHKVSFVLCISGDRAVVADLHIGSSYRFRGECLPRSIRTALPFWWTEGRCRPVRGAVKEALRRWEIAREAGGQDWENYVRLADGFLEAQREFCRLAAIIRDSQCRAKAEAEEAQVEAGVAKGQAEAAKARAMTAMAQARAAVALATKAGDEEVQDAMGAVARAEEAHAKAQAAQTQAGAAEAKQAEAEQAVAHLAQAIGHAEAKLAHAGHEVNLALERAYEVAVPTVRARQREAREAREAARARAEAQALERAKARVLKAKAAQAQAAAEATAASLLARLQQLEAALAQASHGGWPFRADEPI